MKHLGWKEDILDQQWQPVWREINKKDDLRKQIKKTKYF